MNTLAFIASIMAMMFLTQVNRGYYDKKIEELKEDVVIIHYDARDDLDEDEYDLDDEEEYHYDDLTYAGTVNIKKTVRA